jgi:hypothetical protein
MPVRSAGWRAAAGLAVAALAVAGTGCSGSAPASPAPSPAATAAAPASAGQRPVQAPPAGDTWSGSSAEGVWLAIPRTWITINLARVSVSQAARSFATTGIAAHALIADLATLKKEQALVFADPASAALPPRGFTTNASATCQPAGSTSGSGGIASLQATMRLEYAEIRARVQSIQTAPVAGGQAVEARLTVATTGGYSITEVQVVALSSTNRTCFITFSTADPRLFLPVFARSAATIHVG